MHAGDKSVLGAARTLGRHLTGSFRSATHGALRVAVFGAWAVIMATSPVEELVDLPAAVWGSQGVARWMQWAATPDLLEGIRWLTALLCCVVCVGFVRKLVAVPLLGGVLLVEWLKRDCSYGNHAELALIYAALIVLWGEATQRGGATEDQRHRNHRQVLLVTCLGYSLIGARRLASGGLEWVWSGGLVEVMATRAAENRGLELRRRVGGERLR